MKEYKERMMSEKKKSFFIRRIMLGKQKTLDKH